MSEELLMVERPEFVVVGISGRAANDRPDEIGALWARFFAGGAAAQIAGRSSDAIYALYTDYEGDHTRPYTLIIGCMVTRASDLAAGQVARTIPRQRYVVLDADGPQPQTLIATWQRVWTAPIERSFTVDFDQHLSANEVRIHVAVR